MSILGKSWNYINEGNAHIVIGIQNEADKPNATCVLRLIKEDNRITNVNEIRNTVNFVNLIMMPLLTNECDKHLEVVEIPTEEISVLITHLAKFRPKERIIKSHISSYAVKASNLTILEPNTVNYCVEIKPKEGFMASCFKNYGKCYYCLKQYQKLKDNKVGDTSKYCPLDLFSGDKDRMKSALIHLSENPQNNFRVFRNGQIIFNALNKHQFHEIITEMNLFKSVNVFFNFIIGTLLYTGKYSIDKTLDITITTEKSKTCDRSSNLHESTLLHNLLSLQKLSAELNISTTDLKLDSIDYVSTMLQQLDPQEDLRRASDRQTFLERTDPLHKTLISAIAKDCSIMITFTPPCENSDCIIIGTNKIPFKVSVTDLEPKLPKTLVKRKETEKKLIELYERHLKEKYGNPTTLRNPQ